MHNVLNFFILAYGDLNEPIKLIEKAYGCGLEAV
jgi:hypothetical protein